MSVHGIITTHPVLAQLARNPRWTISEPESKKPLDLRGWMLDGQGPYGAKFPDQRCLLTIGELAAILPDPPNCAYRLEAALDGVVVFDVESSCDPALKQRFLEELPWLYAETSMSGRGLHLILPLPAAWHEFPRAIAKPKVQSHDSSYEILISHYATFTGRPLPIAPPPTNDATLALWNQLWCTLAEPADRHASIREHLADASVLARMSLIDDDELDPYAGHFEEEPHDTELSIPGLVEAVERLLTTQGLDELSDHAGDHSRWHWALLGSLYDRLTRHLSDHEDTRPVSEQVYAMLRRLAIMQSQPTPPTPLWTHDQEAFIIYRALTRLVPHRDKHDTLRRGLPLLLDAAIKLVASRQETVAVPAPVPNTVIRNIAANDQPIERTSA